MCQQLSEVQSSPWLPRRWPMCLGFYSSQHLGTTQNWPAPASTPKGLTVNWTVLKFCCSRRNSCSSPRPLLTQSVCPWCSCRGQQRVIPWGLISSSLCSRRGPAARIVWHRTLALPPQNPCLLSVLIKATLSSHILSLDSSLESLRIKLGDLGAPPPPPSFSSQLLCLCDLFLGAQFFQYKNGPCFLFNSKIGFICRRDLW